MWQKSLSCKQRLKNIEIIIQSQQIADDWLTLILIYIINETEKIVANFLLFPTFVYSKICIILTWRGNDEANITPLK